MKSFVRNLVITVLLVFAFYQVFWYNPVTWNRIHRLEVQVHALRTDLNEK